MKIGIDARLYQETGVGRYIKNLIQGLYQLDKQNTYVIFTQKNCLKQIPVSNRWQVVEVNIRWHTLAEQLIFPLIISRYNLDFIHFPYFSVPLFYKGKFIVTVHDLTHLNFPTGKASTHSNFIYQLKYYGYKIILENALKKSEKIIVPSKTVVQEITKTYPSVSKKIEVTYEGGIEIEKVENQKVDYESFILYVGNVYPHKNIENALLALSEINKTVKRQINIVIAGKEDFFRKRLRDFIEQLGLTKNVFFCGELNDQKLANLYKQAICLIFPSLSEGFGLPALEAMQFGCLIACSDIGVFHEICLDLPFYFNPRKVTDIAKKLKEVLLLSNLEKEKIKERELLRAKQFSWKTMARNTLAIYQEVGR